MKNAAVICEYNPFHNGHAYQLSYMRERLGAENIIAVMSGNFVQRGEPAVFDKYIRTEMALSSGADLVIEIPAVFSSASASEFASAGVNAVFRSGIADMLCFGVEGGMDIDKLKTFNDMRSAVHDDDAFNDTVKAFLKKGLSYPAAVNESLKSILSIPEGKPVITEDFFLPNNILALEYIKAAEKCSKIYGRTLDLQAIPRTDAGYSEAAIPKGGSRYASATALRKIILAGRRNRRSEFEENAAGSGSITKHELLRFIPDKAVSLYGRYGLINDAVSCDDMSGILNLRILDAVRNNTDLTAYLDVSREISDRLINMSGELLSFSGRASRLKTRQYTLSRIRRALLHIALGITGESFEQRKSSGYITYIRVLGFRRSAVSSGLLRQLKDNSTVPVVTKPADFKELIAEDVYCDQIYYSIKNKTGEYFRSPVMI